MEVDRRAAFGQIGVASAVLAGLPTVASADGAISSATITKARMVYGGRIANLKSAVEKGDFQSIVDEKNAFVLFNSGAYPTSKSKPEKSKAIGQTNAIFAAIRNNDASALKKAYAEYVKDNDIKPLPTVDPNSGQGYSSDYSYLAKTPAAYVTYRPSVVFLPSWCTHVFVLSPCFLAVLSTSGKFSSSEIRSIA